MGLVSASGALCAQMSVLIRYLIDQFRQIGPSGGLVRQSLECSLREFTFAVQLMTIAVAVLQSRLGLNLGHPSEASGSFNPQLPL